MSFEVLEHDVLGRVGRLKTKTGTVETPLMLPVVNPSFQPVPPSELRAKFGYRALITNAYLVKRKFGDEASRQGIHRLLNFDGVVVTDSGAYQILEYGEVDIAPAEIVNYQESIGTDIGVILDVPTGHKADELRAKRTVDETISRADEALRTMTRNDILWVGPVQGGGHLNLIAYSAREMAKRDFSCYALGSPTPVMEQYQYEKLVDMVMTAKMNLPIDRPLHLFGAGHPMMLAMSVAMGCDIFDSAAYALFARHGRYLTEGGTLKLSEMRSFACFCDACEEFEPARLLQQPADVRERILASHNLHATAQEVSRIREAILQGRLWELMEQRAVAHPTLKAALARLSLYEKILAKHSPSVKSRGIFIFGSESLSRPEVTIHRQRMAEEYTPPRQATHCLLLPADRNDSKMTRGASKRLRSMAASLRHIHVCGYGVPYSVVPAELEWTFPLGQTNTATPYSAEMIRISTRTFVSYLERKLYNRAVLAHTGEYWQLSFVKAFRSVCRRKRLAHRVFKLRGARDAGKVLSFISRRTRG